MSQDINYNLVNLEKAPEINFFKKIWQHKKVRNFLIGGLVLIITGITYFIFAADNTEFYFYPENGNYNVVPGNSYGLNICITPEEEIYNNAMYIKDFVMDIDYSGNGDLIQADSLYVDENDFLTQGSIEIEKDDINSKIKIIGSDIRLVANLGYTSECNNQGFYVGRIVFDVAQNFSISDAIKFKFNENSNNENSITIIENGSNSTERIVTFNESVGSLGLKAGENAIFKMSDDTSNKVYINMENSEVEIGQEIEVEVLIDSITSDVVAVGVDLIYPAELELLEVVKTNNFSVIGQEQSTVGRRIGLVRGTHGDGNPNNGTQTPETNNTGFKGMEGEIAKIKFKAIRESEEITLSLNNLQVVADDSQGSIINNFETKNYNLKILPVKLRITEGPQAVGFEQDGNWEADVSWITNYLADSKIEYILSERINCRSKNYSGAQTINSSEQTKIHLLTTENLEAGQEYCVKVTSTNRDGQKIEGYTSFVPSETSVAFKIINATAEGFFRSAVIRWNTIGGETNGKSNSKIISCTPAVSNLPSSEEDVYTHYLELKDLQSEQNYTCRIESVVRDMNGDGISEATATEDVNFSTKANQGFDSNVTLKVTRDRECDKWLYCNSSLEIINNNNQKENLCFNLGLCDEMGEDGSCVKPISSGDLILAEQEYKNPQKIQNLSGLSKVGFIWDDDQKVNGYYHYYNMKPVGENIVLENSDFENGQIWPWRAERNATLQVVNDLEDKTNKILQIAVLPGETANFWSNTQAPIGKINSDSSYAISFGIKTPTEVSSLINVQFYKEDTTEYYNLGSIQATNYWQTKVVYYSPDSTRSNFSGTINGMLNFGIRSTTQEKDQPVYYLDNILIKPVLKTSSLTWSQSICRLYPSNTAEACDTVDFSGQFSRGWKGYCVEEDPKYEDYPPEERMCLNWWPVDILPGEADVFGNDQQAGYVGRQPLYYCLVAKGNYPYQKNYDFVGNQAIYPYTEVMVDYFEDINPDKFEDTNAYMNLNHKDKFADNTFYYPVRNSALAGMSELFLDNLLVDKNIVNDLYDYEIERIDVEIVGSENESDWPEGETFSIDIAQGQREFAWCGKEESGAHCPTQAELLNKESETYWIKITNNNDNCIWFEHNISDHANVFGARAFFNRDGRFVGLYGANCDASRGAGFVIAKIRIYLKETCLFLAEVVSSIGENYTWSSRMTKGGWAQENSLNYKYDDDYAPYGAAVVPEPANNPSAWENPLYIESPEKSLSQAPYQARGGMPYSVLQTDCRQINGTEICAAKLICENNVCSQKENVIGESQCISGSDDKIGIIGCKSDTECGIDYSTGLTGKCAGVNLSQEQKEEINSVFEAGTSNSGSAYSNEILKQGIERLKKLFAKPIRIWEWGMDYNQGETQDKKNRYTELSENLYIGIWDETRANSETVNYKPRIGNVKINGKEQTSGEIEIDNTQSVVLNFNSYLDANHLPLVSYRVDWGDDSPISSLSQLKIYPRSNENKPHTLLHIYETPGQHTIRVQIEDNWGWCNNGTQINKCPQEINTWEVIGKVNINNN